MSQARLFPDPKPLVKLLGVSFFRELPKSPGVYLMRDARENVFLYLGKARNLRQRLNSYRVANPDRLGRRQLRLLRQVARIEWRLCGDEATALAQEAELLRSIRPKFNRAGVWPVKPKALLWRAEGEQLCLKTGESSAEDFDAGWRCVGPMKGARWLRLTLARVIWLAVNREAGIHEMPVGWHQGRMDAEVLIRCDGQMEEVMTVMAVLNSVGTEPLVRWVCQRLDSKLAPFETAWLEAELEALEGFRLDRIGHATPVTQSRDEQRRFAFA